MTSEDVLVLFAGSIDEVKHWETERPLMRPAMELFPLKLLLPSLITKLLLAISAGIEESRAFFLPLTYLTDLCYFESNR